MAKKWSELRKAFVRKIERIEKNKDVDPANDGPEVELIRFFTRFPNGATCGCGKPFLVWKEIAGKVNPNA
jgi:hypothetical protein